MARWRPRSRARKGPRPPAGCLGSAWRNGPPSTFTAGKSSILAASLRSGTRRNENRRSGRGDLVAVREFVQIQQRPAEFGQAALIQEAEAGGALVSRCGALKGDGEGAIDLRSGLVAGIALHAAGKGHRHLRRK